MFEIVSLTFYAPTFDDSSNLFDFVGVHFFMKLIPLSKNGKKHKGKYFAMVDDNMYEELMKYNWGASVRKNKEVYAVRGVKVGNKIQSIPMHCQVFGEKTLIDHKDRNPLNNQRENLRKATSSQNNANKKPFGTSKYLGVFWHRTSRVKKNKKGVYIKYTERGKWLATINMNRKTKYLGRYKNEEDAARAYDKAAKEIHGEFANLNFPTVVAT